MGCTKRPVLVGFGEKPWSQTGSWAWGDAACYRGCSLMNFSWDLQGKMVDIRTSPWKCPINYRRCADL
jgi:hypothetical protein